MNNGDHYNGTVLSVTTNALAFQSEVLGTVSLSRSKVAQIVVGKAVSANAPTLLPPLGSFTPKPDAAAASEPALLQLRSQTNLIQQVQNQFLGDAPPEAKLKFDQMLNDLSTGRMNLGDLRAEAKSAADQLRSLRKELGADATDGLDGYLTILDNFVQESAPAAGTTTNVASWANPALRPLPAQK